MDQDVPSLRIDRQIRAALEAVAKSLGRSPDDLANEAIADLVRRYRDAHNSAADRHGTAEASGPTFDSLFERAARRVLSGRGVPQDRLEAEIARLRRSNPRLALPALEEVLAAAEVDDRDR